METTTLGSSKDVEHDHGDSGAGAGALLGGALVGASLMYFLDPLSGARRRKRVVDRVNHVMHVAESATGKTARDVRNRAQGLAASVRSRISRDAADEWVLAERVRAELGRVVSHPGAISVNVDGGTVILRGAILASEVDRLVERLRGVRGVEEVVSWMDPHETADNVPALQGGVARRGGKFELRQENWTPAARLLVSAVGGSLAVYGARRRDPLSALLGFAGLAMLTRAVTNTELKRLAGREGRRAVDIQKTINICAPIDVVFTFLTDFENWPRFMTHVREVRRTAPGRQHWVVDGPAGTTVEWDAEITRSIDNELVSWRSVDGSTVQHAGTLRVDPNEDGTTRAQIQMSYNPPAGAAGHAIAVLFRADPKHQLDDDLARLKTTIETGTPPRDAARRDTPMNAPL